MSEYFQMELSSPITDEEWAIITDAELERTSEITFNTPSGRKVVFIKKPTVDAVEVVRCKDCVYYEMLNNNEHYCDAIYRDLSGDDEGVSFEPPEDHFCAYGIRRKANADKGHEG